MTELTRQDPGFRNGVASVLSVIVPGIGQFYNGDFLRHLLAHHHARVLDRAPNWEQTCGARRLLE